jgi:mono/diheme cytochrome c family protein
MRQLGLAAIAVLVWGTAPAGAAGLEAGKEVYNRANCVGCHKWHGGGGGGYGGAALSLRETMLDREQLIEVVRCGRPGTRMPYHDRGAFTRTECFGGVTKADLGPEFPPAAPRFLREPEIEAVVDYVQAQLQGKGAPSLEDCIAYWGEASRECQAMR